MKNCISKWSGLFRNIKLLPFLLILLLWNPYQSLSQQISIAHQDYMKAIGWEDDFIVMNNIIRNELMDRVKGKTDVYYKDNANFFSMVLLLSSVKPIHYYPLKQNGVDVINAITADVRPFDEQSLMSDIAIIGTVIDVASESVNNDGFGVTLQVTISELLKGEVPKDTIKIRQRNSSRLPGNNNRPELNQSYLFLLSSGMYGYHKANHQMRENDEIVVSQPQFGNEEVFVIYRLYPYRNGQLTRAPQNKDEAFNSLRVVDYLLNRK